MNTQLPNPAEDIDSQSGGELGTWRKSSRSGSGDNCVEVKTTSTDVQIRDSKNPAGGRLAMTREAWQSFVEGVRHGEFDL